MDKKKLRLLLHKQVERNRRFLAKAEAKANELSAEQLIYKWKVANCDETMEALPPIAISRADFGHPLTHRWAVICYGGFIVTITRNSRHIMTQHQMRLCIREGNSIGREIATTWTEPSIFVKKEHMLREYMRILCEDIL